MAHEGLVLVGFMGVGKTTVGPLVAEKLGISYHDTDDWVTTEYGIHIPSLVRTNEPRFRRLEARALLEIADLAILNQEPSVISTGGGMPSTEIGRSALRAIGLPVVWMDAPFTTLALRVQADGGGERRPLFDDVAKAHALYDERDPLYEQVSDFAVDADQLPGAVADSIVTGLALR